MRADERFRASLSRLKHVLAGEQVMLAASRVRFLLKAGYRPDQPRVPAGNPDGGQWIDGGETGGDTRVELVSSRRPRGNGQIRIGQRWLPATSGQQLRISISQTARDRAVAEARRIDPSWRPRAQAYETIEGLIEATEATRFEAELRVFALTGRTPAPGPFARGWLDSPPPGQRLTRDQQAQLDLLGKIYGCHGCGSVDKLSPLGHSVGDHHISRALGRPTKILPHCPGCSARQGWLIKEYLKGLK